MTDASSFERIVSEEEDATPMYQTVFRDHSHGEGTMICPLSIVRITVEGNEVT